MNKSYIQVSVSSRYWDSKTVFVLSRQKSRSRLDIDTKKKKSQSRLNIETQKKKSLGLVLSLRLLEIKSQSRTKKSGLAILCVRRRPLMEDDLWRKTTFDGRRPLPEDDLWRKTAFNGRRPLREDHLKWKTTFAGRRLWRKRTFDKRQVGKNLHS